eukprot:305097_1
MAQNWDPPPPPPPPGPPPANQAPQGRGNMLGQPQQMQQRASWNPDLTDKNAAYLAKMRTKQKQRASFNPHPGDPTVQLTSPPDDTPKFSLFGDGFLNKAKMGQKAKPKDISPQKKAYSKYVQLPPTGLTEKQLFEKYRIESNAKIGQGAFARIKVVQGIQDGTKYALKMVRKKGKSRSDIEAFKKEILYLSKLTNHPNIIKMYDFCDSAQGLYMVLEMCNGGDVMQKMEYVKVFKEHEAKHLVKQIVAGLCYFHQHNIVHRDLKLDNLMFNNNVLKIIDFGLAGDCTDKPLNTPCGTIHFTAPEVLSSYDYNISADMWSLGVIIYLLICGFPPFFDNQGNEQKLFQIIKRAKFTFIKMYFDECHPSVKELISDLLKKRPIERLTAQEVRNHEWFTGIKQPRKVVPLVMGLDSPTGKKQEFSNPFLDKKDEPKNLPPYMRSQQQQQKAAKAKAKANVPPYMRAQQNQIKPQVIAAGPPPPAPGQPGQPGQPNQQSQAQHYYYGQKKPQQQQQQQQQQPGGGYGNYQQPGGGAQYGGQYGGYGNYPRPPNPPQ